MVGFQLMRQNLTNRLFNRHKEGLTEEQREALERILKEDCGIRILRGRAGTGKSRVLGKFARVASDAGINVIGLAATHKAKLELRARGYGEVETIKGLLFKYRNGRFVVPKGSVFVVDEAGMVGNDDYTELLKVAANRKCNVILAGDERQLASIQRGGMFEVFAIEYGSSLICDIRRQSEEWAKSVSTALSNGLVRSGVELLYEKGKIVESADKEESIKALVRDWIESSRKLEHKLIIAVKNADVDSINEAVRENLIERGRISSSGVRIGGKIYAKGDRVIIKETNKDAGLVNGDFGIIEEIGVKSCVIVLDGDGEREGGRVEFDPRKYQGFRHGYATTVYKSQGASISEVFVFHNGFGGVRNAYVALSRCINDMKLYINEGFTVGREHLIKQLGHDGETGSSLRYKVKEEIERAREDGEKERTILGKIVRRVKAKVTEIRDKRGYNGGYYEYEAPVIAHSKVEEVLEREAAAGMLETGENTGEVAIAVGAEQIRMSNGGGTAGIESRVEKKLGIALSNAGNRGAVGSKRSEKERFYERVARSRNKERTIELRDYKQETANLRRAMEYNSDRIVRDLLGEPNKNLSKGNVYRYGGRGSLAVYIRGARAGTWYDFEIGKGGDMFALVQRERGGDFKDAAEYLKDMFGIARARTLKTVYDNELEEKYARYVKVREQESKEAELKAKAVEKLYGRAKEIKETSIANRYLREIRNIKLETPLGEDIKTAGIYRKEIEGEKGKYFPALVVFARDKDGKVTGGQQILLDKKTGNKADVELPKRSFGKIAGSFVEVGKKTNAHNAERITIIAEGIETALSIKQALADSKRDLDADYGNNAANVNIKILCSLGISNVKNYAPESEEKIIIAADNDGKGAITNKTISNAKLELEEKGAFVEIVKPQTKGDFNDLLQEHGIDKGNELIKAIFNPAITKHTTADLERFLHSDEMLEGGEKRYEELSSVEKENIAYLNSYEMPHGQIIKAYRRSEAEGKKALEATRKDLDSAVTYFNDNKHILEEAKDRGYNGGNMFTLIKNTMGMNAKEAELYYIQVRHESLTNYVNNELNLFKRRALGTDKVEEVIEIKAERQEFLVNTYENLSPAVRTSRYKDDELVMTIIEALEEKNNKEIDNLREAVNILCKQGAKSEGELAAIIAKAENITTVKNELIKSAEQERNSIKLLYKNNIDSLEKLGFKLDYDKSVNLYKRFKTGKEMSAYMDKLTAEETSKYIDTLGLEQMREEKAKAKTLPEMLNILDKEQRAYRLLHNEHKFGIDVTGQLRGSYKISINAERAERMHNAGGMKRLEELIAHGLTYKIFKEEDILDKLKQDSEDLLSVYRLMHVQCRSYHETEIDKHIGYLEQNKTVSYEGKLFTDKKSYLEYLHGSASKSGNNIMPIEKINKELELHKQHLEQRTKAGYFDYEKQGYRGI